MWESKGIRTARKRRLETLTRAQQNHQVPHHSLLRHLGVGSASSWSCHRSPRPQQRRARLASTVDPLADIHSRCRVIVNWILLGDGSAPCLTPVRPPRPTPRQSLVPAGVIRLWRFTARTPAAATFRATGTVLRSAEPRPCLARGRTLTSRITLTGRYRRRASSSTLVDGVSTVILTPCGSCR